MNREDYVDALAGEILKTAAEEVENSPFCKLASETDMVEAVVEKVASVAETAGAIYKQAEAVAAEAAGTEAAARAALEEAGVDPDEVLAAAEQIAAQQAAE